LLAEGASWPTTTDQPFRGRSALGGSRSRSYGMGAVWHAMSHCPAAHGARGGSPIFDPLTARFPGSAGLANALVGRLDT